MNRSSSSPQQQQPNVHTAATTATTAEVAPLASISSIRNLAISMYSFYTCSTHLFQLRLQRVCNHKHVVPQRFKVPLQRCTLRFIRNGHPCMGGYPAGSRSPPPSPNTTVTLREVLHQQCGTLLSSHQPLWRHKLLPHHSLPRPRAMPPSGLMGPQNTTTLPDPVQY